MKLSNHSSRWSDLPEESRLSDAVRLDYYSAPLPGSAGDGPIGDDYADKARRYGMRIGMIIGLTFLVLMAGVAIIVTRVSLM